MSRSTPHAKKMYYTPGITETLETVGNQIRLARMRRKYTINMIAERAGVSRQTVWKVEKGDPAVAFGIYAKVLQAIGLRGDLLLIAKDDELGRLLQDAELERKYNGHKKI